MTCPSERPEGANAGTAKLVGTSTSAIVSSVELLLNNNAEYNKIAKSVNPYGDGTTSKNIYKFIRSLS